MGIGFYTSLAGPFTNKLYGGEYVQYYPGYKVDIGGVKKKFEASWLGFSLDRFKCSANNTDVINDNVSIHSNSMSARNDSMDIVSVRTDSIGSQVNAVGVNVIDNEVALENTEIKQRSNSVNIHDSKVRKLSVVAHLEAIESAVANDGVKVIERRLTMF